MPDTDEQTLNRIRQLTRTGQREHESRLPRYDESYEVWRIQSKADKLPRWRSRIFVPYAQASIDTALVNVVSGIPRCIVKPRRPQDVLSARAMQAVIDYQVQEAHLSEPQVLFAQQGLIMGVTVAKNHWVYRETEKMTRGYQSDGFGTMSETVRPENLVVRDGPCFEPWSVYDCWWDPNARDVDSARYIVLRSYKTKEELERDSYDDERQVGKYRNLEKLFESGASRTRQSTAQEAFLGNTDMKRKDAFELWEVWEDDRLTVVGNGQVVLREIPNPYWHGCKPVVIAQTRPDLFEMQGVAETELLRDIQAALHTLQNMTIDHLHMTVLPIMTYRAGSVFDPNVFQLKPRGMWPVNDHDDVNPLKMPPLDSNVFVERQRLLGDAERVTGISAYVGGADTTTIDQTTATGVTALQSAANTLLRFKARQIHDKGFQRTFEQWGEMTQQFMSEPLWTEIVGKDLIGKLQAAGHDVQDGETPDSAWWQVSPQEVVGHYRYHLEGTEESLSRQQARSEAVALLNAFTPYVQLGVVNPRALLERVAIAYDIQDVDSLMMPGAGLPAQAAPNGQPPEQQNGQVPPGQMTLQNGAMAPLGVAQAVGYAGGR